MLRKIISVLLIAILMPFNSSFINILAADFNQNCDRLSSGVTTNANCSQLPIVFENSSFEQLNVSLPTDSYVITDQANVPGWNTTATDGKIEVWSKGFYNTNVGTAGNGGITGDRIVELNATQDSALYQDFATQPGQTLKIYLNHGGRNAGDNLNVVVGAPIDVTNPTIPTAGGNADIIASSTAGRGEWKEVAVEYVVPEGQTTTRIAFVSGGTMHSSIGNFLDNVVVGIDSVYDNVIDIVDLEQTGSYADTFEVTNTFKYISGAYLGKYQLVINTENFENIRNARFYDGFGAEITPDSVTYENDKITIVGGSLDEGHVTFEADSTIRTGGTLKVDSTFNYFSQMDIALIEAGLKDGSNYYYASNSATYEVVNKGPEITGKDITIAEGSNYTEQQLITMLEVSALDYEDNLEGIDVELTHGPVNVDQSTPGEYPITFTAVGSQGLETTATFTITVSDVKPVITSSNEQIEIVVGSDISEYSDTQLLELFDVSATELEEGDLTSNVTVSHQINPMITGKYDVTFEVTDNDGTNAEPLIVKAAVVRSLGGNETGVTPGLNTKPTITGLKSYSINEEAPMSDEQLLEAFEVVATDDINDTLDLTVDQSQVKYSRPGTYPVVFTVVDNGGLQAKLTSEITILNLYPTLNFNAPSAEISLGTEVSDQFFMDLFDVQASEVSTGDLNDKVLIRTNVNPNVTGQYHVLFEVVDEEGNMAYKGVKLYVVRSIPDIISPIDNSKNTAPKITATSSVTIDEEQPLTEAQIIKLFNISVSDARDSIEDIMYSIDDSQVDYSKPGIYQIKLTATDSEGLTTTKSVELIIKDVLPVINLTHTTASIYLDSEVSSERLIELYGASASEISFGDLSSSISVSEVNSDVTGEYSVLFSVTDEEGNLNFEEATLIVKRNINNGGIGVIQQRNTAPTITANQFASLNEGQRVSEKQLISLFNVAISDAQDDTSSLKLQVNSKSVNYTKPGSYPVTFTVTDSGNLSSSFTASIVIQDLKPEIYLQNSSLNIQVGTNLSSQDLIAKFGVIATEVSRGDLTARVNATGLNDVSEPGQYLITFSVTDDEGNLTTALASINFYADPSADSISPLIVGDYPISTILPASLVTANDQQQTADEKTNSSKDAVVNKTPTPVINTTAAVERYVQDLMVITLVIIATILSVLSYKVLKDRIF